MKYGCLASKYQISARTIGAMGLAWGLTACSSVDAQQPQRAAAPQGNTAVAAAQPGGISSPSLAAPIAPLVMSPTMPAVIAAREAMNRRQWSVLGDLAPQAEEDLLAMYPQYWALRYNLWNMPPATRPISLRRPCSSSCSRSR